LYGCQSYRGVVPAPPGVVMVARQTLVRNGSRAQSEGRAPGGKSEKRGQYWGRVWNRCGDTDPSPASRIRRYFTSLPRSAHLPWPPTHTII